MSALCVGKSDLFDSTHAADHLEARELCLACPVINWCEDRRKQTSTGGGYAQTSLVGTWAGKLYGAKKGALRQMREEQAFTDEEARAAHTAFWHGDTSDQVKTGERVYQRRAARRQRAKDVA